MWPGDLRSCERISRGKILPERAQALYTAAGHSVGLQEGRKAIILEMKEILSEIES